MWQNGWYDVLSGRVALNHRFPMGGFPWTQETRMVCQHTPKIDKHGRYVNINPQKIGALAIFGPWLPSQPSKVWVIFRAVDSPATAGRKPAR